MMLISYYGVTSNFIDPQGEVLQATQDINYK